MPVRLDQDSDAGQRGPHQAVSAVFDIRAWAKATGLPVSDRGRIPASVVDQYEATTRRPLRTPVTIGMNQSAQTVSGRGRPVNGVPDLPAARL